MLGVHRVTIREHLKKYEREEEAQRELEEMLRQRRQFFLQIRREYPEACMTQLRQRNPAIYEWLKKHDETWLLDHRPPQRPHLPKKREKRVDWEKRDEEVLQKLQLAVKSLRQQKKPVRISKTRLGREIRTGYMLNGHLKDMPRTAAYLEGVLETVEDFQIRRIRWAAGEVDKEGKHVSPYAIRVKAGFLNPKLITTRQWEEIYRQASVYEHIKAPEPKKQQVS